MATLDLIIQQGASFNYRLRLESELNIYKPISGIEQSAPVRISCLGHGIPEGWRVAVVSVKGMVQINALNSPPKPTEYMKATVIDADTISFNGVNAADYRPYQSGGYLQYFEPIALGNDVARMTIKDKIGGNVLLELSTSNGRVAITPANFTIDLFISAVDTHALNFDKGVYDLEYEYQGGEVARLLSGNVLVSKEVTT